MQWVAGAELHRPVLKNNSVLEQSKARPKLARLRNVSRTEQPSLGQAALELGATPRLHFLKNRP
jgi:hypothetical protein